MIKFFYSIPVFVFLLACNNDDDVSEEIGPNILSEENDSRILSIEELEDGIIFPFGTLIKGEALPSPTGDVSMNLEENTHTSFQRVGYDFNLKAMTIVNYAGVYIRLIDAEGNKSGNYYNLEFVKDFGTDLFNIPFKIFTSFNNLLDTQGTSISDKKTVKDFFDVNYKESLGAGKFSYEIAIYDEDGNVSPFENVDVIIIELGGSNDIIGDWELEKIEFYEDSESIQTVLKGGFQCTNHKDSSICNNADNLELCDQIVDFNLTFNENGSFDQYYNSIIRNFELSDECDIEFIEIDYTLKSDGLWFVESNELNAYIFNYNEIFRETDKNISLDEELLLISGTIRFSEENELLLTQREVFEIPNSFFNGNSFTTTISVFERVTEYYFIKK